MTIQSRQIRDTQQDLVNCLTELLDKQEEQNDKLNEEFIDDIRDNVNNDSSEEAQNESFGKFDDGLALVRGGGGLSSNQSTQVHVTSATRNNNRSRQTNSKKSLPNTGDTASALDMVGLAMATLALFERRRRCS